MSQEKLPVPLLLCLILNTKKKMDLKVNMYKNKMFYICLKIDRSAGYGDLLGRKRHKKRRGRMARGSSNSIYFSSDWVTSTECK